jgi:hypothetical protein
MGLSKFDETSPFNLNFTFASPGNSFKVDVLAPTEGRKRLDHVILANSDSIDHHIRFMLYLGALHTILGSFLVPHGAGQAGAATVDAVAVLAAIGQELPVMYYPFVISVILEEAMTGGAVDISFLGGNV